MSIVKDRYDQSLPCNEPAKYRIRVRGTLNEQWSDCLGG